MNGGLHRMLFIVAVRGYWERGLFSWVLHEPETAPVKEGGKVGVWRILPIGLADFFFFSCCCSKKVAFVWWGRKKAVPLQCFSRENL